MLDVKSTPLPIVLNKKMENDVWDDGMKEKSDDDTGIVSKYHWRLSFIKQM
jgi:hypothetical protein